MERGRARARGRGGGGKSEPTCERERIPDRKIERQKMRGKKHIKGRSTRVRARARAHTHTHTHKHAYTRTRTHTHTHTHRWSNISDGLDAACRGELAMTGKPAQLK